MPCDNTVTINVSFNEPHTNYASTQNMLRDKFDLKDKVAPNCVIQYTTKMLNKCISYVGCGVIFLYCRES